MKVIFLDFDGVLNCEKHLVDVFNKDGIGSTLFNEVIDPEAIKVLNEIIKQTEAKVVVISTWRKNHTIQQLQEILNKKGFIGDVVGKTGNSPSGYRGEEIYEWLSDEAGDDDCTKSFVVIDDGSDMKPYMNRLVQTNYLTGLLPEHINKCVEILNKNFSFSSKK